MLTDGIFGNTAANLVYGISSPEIHQNRRHHLAHGIGNLPAARVAQCYDHRHGIVLGRMFHSLPEFLLNLLGQPLHIADHAEAHIVLHEDFVFE